MIAIIVGGLSLSATIVSAGWCAPQEVECSSRQGGGVSCTAVHARAAGSGGGNADPLCTVVSNVSWLAFLMMVLLLMSHRSRCIPGTAVPQRWVNCEGLIVLIPPRRRCCC